MCTHPVDMDYSSLRERRLSLARGKEGEGERGGKINKTRGAAEKEDGLDQIHANCRNDIRWLVRHLKENSIYYEKLLSGFTSSAP